MPRTVEEIVEHADELAKLFEDHDPDPSRITPAQPLCDVAAAFRSVAMAEQGLRQAVSRARRSGHSWADIAAMVGTSAEAARQRYGRHRVQPHRTKAAG